MAHDPLVLRITSSARGTVARVASSPAGESEPVPFENPLTQEDLERVAGAVASGAHRGGWRHLLGLDRKEPPADLLAIGRRLSEAVFQGSVGATLAACLGTGSSVPEAPLRIEIKIDTELPEAARLQALPWELLIAPRRRRPLALSTWTPVVRYLEVSRGAGPPALPEPLTLLVVAPHPRGLPALAVEREIDGLRAAWAGEGLGGPARPVCVEVLEPPTLDALCETLRRRPVHALHFIGHGRSGARPAGVSAGGELLFEDASGGLDPVDAEVLAGQLEDFAATLRVIVLNACESARGGRDERGEGGDGPEDRSALAGSVAAALVDVGVPAVVAMRYPIRDEAALELSRTLYRSLARGESIDQAVTEGRLAICRTFRGSAEWLTPALFLRSKDGHLFALPDGLGAMDEPPRLPPPGASTGRPARWTRWAAAAGLAAILAGGSVWVQRRVGDPDESPARAASSEDGRGAAVDPVGSGVTRGEPMTGGQAGADESETVGPPGEETIQRLVTPPPTTPEPGSEVASSDTPFVTLKPGETVAVGDGSLSVAVDFLAVGGEEFARITVAADDGGVGRKAVVAPGEKTIALDGRTVRVQVSELDFVRRRVTLRLLPSG